MSSKGTPLFFSSRLSRILSFLELFVSSVRAQTGQHHPADANIASLWLHGELPTYIIHEDKQPAMRAIGVSHTTCKYEFHIFEVTAGVYFKFYDIHLLTPKFTSKL